MTLNVTLKDSEGDTIDWGDVSAITPLVTGLTQYFESVIPIDSAAPSVTTDTNVITLTWTADQTAAFSRIQSAAWSLSVTISGTGPLALVAGTIAFTPSTTPGSGTSTSADLAVTVGGTTADLAVTLGGSGGSAASLDPGYLSFYVGGGVEIDPPHVFVAPPAIEGLAPSIPFFGSDWTPLQVISDGELFGIFFDSDLTAASDAHDTVDVDGELVVWDQAGINVLVASFSVSGVNSGTGTDISSKLTQIQVVGGDLSIVDPGIVQSVAGGSYNILLKVFTAWD